MNKPVKIEKLSSSDPHVKYGYGKQLLELAKKSPEKLAGYFRHWVDLLDSSNNILKWTAIDILGYLSAVKEEDKSRTVIPLLIRLLQSGKLITTNHVIFALGLIAENKAQYREEIVGELLKVANYKYETEECKDIVIGKALLALMPFADDLKTDNRTLPFIKLAGQRRRPATKKKAEALKKKIFK